MVPSSMIHLPLGTQIPVDVIDYPGMVKPPVVGILSKSALHLKQTGTVVAAIEAAATVLV